MAAVKKRGGVNCSAFNCFNREYNCDLSFFRFPKDPERSKKWVVNCRLDGLEKLTTEQLYRNRRLCSKHFEDSQFKNASEKTSLNWNAVPTLFNVPNPPSRVTPKRKAPTPRISGSETKPKRQCIEKKLPLEVDNNTQDNGNKTRKKVPDTPRKIALKKKIKQLRTKIWRQNKSPKASKHKQIDNIIEQLREYLPSETVNFISTQIRMSQRSRKELRWPPQEKVLALSIYYHSKKAYKVLGKLFKLPSRSTLLRILNSSDKICALIFDEMCLKTGLTYNSGADSIEGFEDFGEHGKTKNVANHALVFTIRGLKEKWKQPLGYFLSSGPISAVMLQTLVRLCIEKVHSIGFTVKVLICDQGSNNRSFIEKKEHVTVDSPFFMVGNNKVFVMYDPPHLLKNIRNNFMKQGFLSGNDEIKWEYVVDFHTFDKERSIRMAPKLTDNHINLRPFAAMRVNLAAQILRHSVAAGISTLAALEKLPSEAQNTASFIELFDKLFNTFNSGSLKSHQQYRHAFSNESNHKDFLETCLNYLSKLTLRNGRKVPCIEGWRLNIKALSLLWDELHNAHGFKFLLTNRLNQDCVENMFSIVRGKGGHRDNPTCEQFRASFRAIVVEQLLVPSKNTNCQFDLDKVLIDISTMSKVPQTNAPVNESPGQNEAIDLVSKNAMSLYGMISIPDNVPVKNVSAYMSGYVLRKMNISCLTCKNKLIVTSIPSKNELYMFLQEKAFQEKGTLVYPSHIVIQMFYEIEQSFSLNFPNMIHMNNLMVRLLKSVLEFTDGILDCDNLLCKEKFLGAVKLYLKVRLYSALKRANFDSYESGQKRNRKVLKLKNL